MICEGRTEAATVGYSIMPRIKKLPSGRDHSKVGCKPEIVIQTSTKTYRMICGSFSETLTLQILRTEILGPRSLDTTNGLNRRSTRPVFANDVIAIEMTAEAACFTESKND